MQQDEIQHQIAKFKTRRLKTRLAHYSMLTSSFLALSIFGSGFTRSTLLTFLLVLPLPLYFCLETFKLARKNRVLKARLNQLESSVYHLSSKFSLGSFVTQPSLSFRLCLILFFLACFTMIARVRTTDPVPTLSYHLESGI